MMSPAVRQGMFGVAELLSLSQVVVLWLSSNVRKTLPCLSPRRNDRFRNVSPLPESTLLHAPRKFALPGVVCAVGESSVQFPGSVSLLPPANVLSNPVELVEHDVGSV